MQNAINEAHQIADPEPIKVVRFWRVGSAGNADVPVKVAVLEVVKENRPALSGDRRLQKSLGILLVRLTENASIRVRSTKDTGEPLKTEIAERCIADINGNAQTGQSQLVPN